MIITQFTKCIYYITDDNIYHRGKLYPLLLVPLVVLSLYNYAVLFFKRKYISKKHLIAFIIYLTLPSVCMLVQMFLYGLLLTVIGTSIASIFMFLFILSDQIEHYIMQKEENARQRASINVLEMRPHFINNTLTSIYYLCEQNPEKAQALILNFNTYLRKNFIQMIRLCASFFFFFLIWEFFIFLTKKMHITLHGFYSPQSLFSSSKSSGHFCSSTGR